MMWVALLLILLWLASMLRWRRQLVRVPVLEPVPEQADAPVDEYLFITAEGVELDEATRRSAAVHARDHGELVLDLIPSDLPTDRLIIVAMLYEPKGERLLFSPGRTARVAMVVERGLAEQAGVEQQSGLNPLEMAELGRWLKNYAARAFDAVAVPGLPSNDEPLRWRLPMQQATLGLLSPFYMMLEIAILAALGLSIAFAPVWGLVALALNHVAPLGATLGTAFRPRDALVTLLFRSVVTFWRWLMMLLGPSFDPTREELEQKRKVYTDRMAQGIDAFFEPRQTTCPLCGSEDLSTYIECPDMLQHKPGRFRVERCGACLHLFQNPRLTLDGLDFYYADFYDGLGKKQTEAIFGIGNDDRYTERANLVKGHGQPRTWLDVGGGYGHFSLAARDVWPETRFDGLDFSDGVEEGVRRGWIDNGYRGLFPELCGEIPKYDVVSMSHYLEHTLDPEAEIRAARTALDEGGLFVIEMPNGVARTGKLLGRFWLPFFQPQHQHLLSLENLERLLIENGFEIVERTWGEAHSSSDFTGASYLLIKQIAGAGEVPWRPPQGALGRLRYRMGWALFTPLILVGFVLDAILSRNARTPERSNAYRILARKGVPQASA